MKVAIELSESHGITLFHDTHYIQLLSNYYTIIIPLLYHHYTIIIPLFYYCQSHRLYTYHYYHMYIPMICRLAIITIITIITYILYHYYLIIIIIPNDIPCFCCLFSHSPLLPRTHTARSTAPRVLPCEFFDHHEVRQLRPFGCDGP